MRKFLPVIPKNIVGYLNVIILIVAWVAIFLFFCSKRPSFSSIDNIQLLARQGTIVCVAALGMTYIIILGGIDLSVGSVMAFVAVAVAWVLKHNAPAWEVSMSNSLSSVFHLSVNDFRIVEAAIAGIAAGTLCGFVNGFLVTRLKVVPFIVTLGTYLVVRGAAKGLAGEQKIDADMTWLNDLLAKIQIQNVADLTRTALIVGAEILGFLAVVLVIRWIINKQAMNLQVAPRIATALFALVGLPIAGFLVQLASKFIPITCWILIADAGVVYLVVTLLFGWMIKKRGLKLHTASRTASILLTLGGLPLAINLVHLVSQVFPIGVWILIVMAVIIALMLKYTRFGRYVVAVGSNEQAARLCGVPVERVKLLVYMLGGFCAGVAGLLLFSRLSVGDPTAAMGQELDVIAAVVIGGASLSGGVGSILGSLIGAIIMVTLKAGGTQLGWSNWVQEIITGAIIIASVALDRLRTTRDA